MSLEKPATEKIARQPKYDERDEVRKTLHVVLVLFHQLQVYPQ